MIVAECVVWGAVCSVSLDQINSRPVIFTSWLCVTLQSVCSIYIQDQSTAKPATLTQDTRTLGNRCYNSNQCAAVVAVDATTTTTTAVYGRGGVAEEGSCLGFWAVRQHHFCGNQLDPGLGWPGSETMGNGQ